MQILQVTLGFWHLIPKATHLLPYAGGCSKGFFAHASEDLRRQILEEKIVKKRPRARFSCGEFSNTNICLCYWTLPGLCDRSRL